MYEIYALITDELGSRAVPTGFGFYLETTAYDRLTEMQIIYPNDDFYVEFVPSSDHFNSY
jgi:hypothetical protein